MRGRVVAVFVAAFVVLPALAWTGTFFFWRVRIAVAIRTIHRWSFRSWPPPSDVEDASRVLSGARCWAIPQLLDALEGSKNAEVSSKYSEFVIARVMADPGLTVSDEYHSRAVQVAIYPDSQAAAREEKIRNMQTWWREHRAKHPWWRVWSSKCVFE